MSHEGITEPMVDHVVANVLAWPSGEYSLLSKPCYALATRSWLLKSVTKQIPTVPAIGVRSTAAKWGFSGTTKDGPKMVSKVVNCGLSP